MDDFAIIAELSILLDDFAEWVSDMDVRLGKSEVMLRSFDGIHECVCSVYMSDTFSQRIDRNTHHSSKIWAVI